MPKPKRSQNASSGATVVGSRPFDEFAQYPALIVHFLRPVDRARARTEWPLFVQGAASGDEQHRHRIASGVDDAAHRIRRADADARTVQLVRRAPFLHRLINDELNDVGTEESRARVRGMNLDLVAYYRDMLSADGGRELVEADPLFLYVAVLGVSDFFSSAEPLIRDLLPKGTDMDKVSADFQAFLVRLILDGLRKR